MPQYTGTYFLPWVFTGSYFLLWVCTWHVEVHTLGKGTYLRENVHTLGWKYIIFGSYTSMYQYVPGHTLVLNLVLLFFDFRRVHLYYISVYTDHCWVHTLSIWFYCTPAKPSQFACQQFRHLPTHWTKSHYIWLVTAALPVPVSELLREGAGLLGDSAAAGQLSLLAAIVISCLLTSSISPSQQCTVLMGVWRTWVSSWGLDDEQ